MMLLFHPGDLGLIEWAILLFMLFALIVLPILIVGFIIYKIATRSRDDFQMGITKKDGWR